VTYNKTPRNFFFFLSLEDSFTVHHSSMTPALVAQLPALVAQLPALVAQLPALVAQSPALVAL
jgi:hypothetical protein